MAHQWHTVCRARLERLSMRRTPWGFAWNFRTWTNRAVAGGVSFFHTPLPCLLVVVHSVFPPPFHFHAQPPRRRRVQRPEPGQSQPLAFRTTMPGCGRFEAYTARLAPWRLGLPCYRVCVHRGTVRAALPSYAWRLAARQLRPPGSNPPAPSGRLTGEHGAGVRDRGVKLCPSKSTARNAVRLS